MTVLEGIGVSGGIAFGRIAFLRHEKRSIAPRRIEDDAAETERFHCARKAAITELGQLYDAALAQVGEKEAAIFEIHQMMLEDDDFCTSVIDVICSQKLAAEYAVAVTGEKFARDFADMSDDYMRQRAIDVRDISERLINILSGAKKTATLPCGEIILAADDLTPSETLGLDRKKILAIITSGGSVNSHTAILARTMNIPAVVSLTRLSGEYDGMEAAVDAGAGILHIEPDEDTRHSLEQRREEQLSRDRLLNQLKGKENKTIDGQTIEVCANIGGAADMEAALKNDADGIGLFRSEFLYLQASTYPTEDELFAAYKHVVEGMNGKRVIIRTLDIGADKQIGYFDLPKEENPALGYRAIRICLDRPEVFMTQLRAIYRASAFGTVSIMFPMITSVEEVRAIKEIVYTVKLQLESEKIAYSSNVELGIMIETPAAVMISDLLADEVDFFSIGTNDLTQYTLAADRQNPLLDKYINPHHRGLIRMIKMVVENAHKKEKWVGICGELAADISLTETFLAMKIDELSVAPSYILPLRDKIRSCDISETGQDILLNIK